MAFAKAAGPDLIPAEFYRYYEDEVAEILTNLFTEIHEIGRLPASFREGDIALIYKKKNPEISATIDQ